MNVLRPIRKEFYGDDNRWFFGTVVNSQPPAGLEGRVKVRINGVHSPSTGDIPEKDLPWAQVLIPTTEGGVSGVGRIPQLQTGSFVFGVFLDGASSQIPLVMGSLPRVEVPCVVQSSRVKTGETTFNYKTQRFQNVVATQFKNDLVAQADIDLRRLQSMKFFIDNGYEVTQAAAITGGLEGISTFITYDDRPEADSPFTGVASWRRSAETGSRYQGLLRFAAQYAPSSDWKLYSIQLQFVLFELRNRFSAVNNEIIFTTDIEVASNIFNRKYLFSSNNTTGLAERAYNEVIS
jgi:hypothetical protein